MSSTRKAIVFGLAGLNSPIKFEGEEIFLEGKDFKGHLGDFDIIIYFGSVFAHKFHTQGFTTRLEPAPYAAIQRQNELRIALDKGRIVCFIGSNLEDYVLREIFALNDIRSGYINDDQRVVANLDAKRSEFKPYLDDVGATQVAFSPETIGEAISLKNGYVVGFSKLAGKGLLLFIPTVWGSADPKYVVEHLKQLVASLTSYSVRVSSQPPDYLDSFVFTKEKEAKDRIEKIIASEVKPLQATINRYLEIKSILWLGDRNLVSATNKFLQTYGFCTEIDEKYEEDLWILSSEGEREFIVEVKGLNKNLTREHISAHDQHREAREVPYLIGLIIANTFRAADSINRKDESFPPNVIEKAVNSNMIITRTLDLCRIVDFLEKSNKDVPLVLIPIMLKQKGWLTLRDDRIELIQS